MSQNISEGDVIEFELTEMVGYISHRSA